MGKQIKKVSTPMENYLQVLSILWVHAWEFYLKKIWREGGEEGGAVDFFTAPFHLLLLRLSVYHYIVIMYKFSYGEAVLEGLFPFVKISCML